MKNNFKIIWFALIGLFALSVVLAVELKTLNPTVQTSAVLVRSVNRSIGDGDKTVNVLLSEKTGQSIIVGIPNSVLDADTLKILKYIKPGGIVLYARNYDSISQLKELVDHLQRFASENIGLPFFVMLDEEPGGAMRLDVFHDAFPLGAPDWNAIEKGVGILKNVGVNINLAPIADFPFNEDTFIKRRVPFGKKEENLMFFNRTFIDIMNSHQIFATLKHFPGAGMLTDDPHKKMPYSDVEENVFDRSLQIFQDGIENGAQFVMTNHAVYQNIDPDNPATLSFKIVEKILKDQLGFRGLVLTDDLSDMPLGMEGMNLGEAGIRALKAGHNLIMFSHELENTKGIFDFIAAVAENDPELKSRIEENYEKIKEFKQNNLIQG